MNTVRHRSNTFCSGNQGEEEGHKGGVYYCLLLFYRSHLSCQKEGFRFIKDVTTLTLDSG